MLSNIVGRCSSVDLIGIRQMVHILLFYLLLNRFFDTSFVDTLRDYFTQFGKVDACTIMRDAAGRSRCFAFLTFEDPASVNAVMVREHVLDGKIVRFCSHLYTTTPHHACFRLTPNGRFRGKSINEPLSFSSVAFREVSHQSLCANSSRNLAKSLIQQLCWIERQDEVKVLVSFHLRIRTFPRSSVLGTLKLMGNW